MKDNNRSRFWVALLGASVVLAGAAVLVIVVAGGGDDKAKPAANARAAAAAGSQIPPFELSYPDSWKRINADGRKGDPPRVAISRKSGDGLVTMTIRGPVKQSLSSLKKQMLGQIKQRFPGAQDLQSKHVHVTAGSGLLTTWFVKKTGRVQSNLVVPSGNVSYSIDAVLPAGADKAAEEVAQILRAFDAKPAR